MKLIPLTRGLSAKVDDEDFDRVNQHKWWAGASHKRFYAVRKLWIDGKRIIQTMQGFVMGTDAMLDHKDNDSLNNQKDNLREATRVENGRNRKIQYHSTKFKGVSFIPRQRNWQASGSLNKRKIHIGTYSSPELAALAYDTFAQAFYGSFARTNKQMGVL